MIIYLFLYKYFELRHMYSTVNSQIHTLKRFAIKIHTPKTVFFSRTENLIKVKVNDTCFL
jgi:hypothetical protein